jgi:signal transduction histidine kinase
MTVRQQLLLAIAYPLLVAIVSLAVPLTINVHDRVTAEVRDRANARATLVAANASDFGEADENVDLQALADEGSRRARGRVVLVDARGRLLADSSRSAPAGTDFTGRPEIRDALTGRRVQLERDSETLGQRLLATAVPIVHEGRTIGAVRITQSTAAVSAATDRAVLGIAALAGIVVALGLGVAVLLSARLARPTQRLEEAADAVASGRLGHTVEPEGAVEHRRLARSFNVMSGQVKELVEAQGRFVADASHQLRTPLTGTRLQLENVLYADDLDEARASAQIALGEVDRLARTVDELLLLTRGAEDGAREAVPLDLTELAAGVAARWAEAAAARDQRIVAEVTARRAAVLADPADVERAVDALVENALAYADPGATTVVRADGPRLLVLDEGPGLTDADLEEVFDRFHRGSASVKAPGSGLGLAIARQLAERNGAALRLARREDGPGTVASVDFGGPA